MEEYSATYQQVSNNRQGRNLHKGSQLKLFLTEGKIRVIHRQENNGVNIILNLFFRILFILHIGITYQLLSTEILKQYFNQIINKLYSEVIIYRILQAITIMLKLIIIQSVYMQMFNDSIIIGVTWFNKKIFQSLYTIKQLDLSLTAYLLLIDWRENVFFYLVSVVFDIFYIVYMQNYIFRKDLFYVSSVRQNIIFRFLIIIGYLSNIAFLKFGNLVVFCAYIGIYSLGLFLWFIIWGKNLYIHHTMYKHLLIMTAIQGTIGVCLFQAAVSNFQILKMQNIAQIFVILIVLAAVLSILENKNFKIGIKIEEKGKLKQYEIQMQGLLQLSNSSIQMESILYGVFKSHFLNCKNNKCPSYNDQIFQPVLKVMTKPKQIANHKDSCFRFYFICQYESWILRYPSDVGLILDYCEFLYNELGNIYVLMQYIERVQKLNLSIVDKIRVSKIRAIVRYQNQRFNKQLYRGKVELEHVIESEECFESIQRNTKKYIKQNLSVWNDFLSAEIDLSVFSGKLSQTFRLIDQINQSWKKIYRYLSFHRHWRFIYLNFLLFIKNEKTKIREVDESIVSHKGSHNFNNEKIFLDSTNFKNEQLMTERVLFDRDSFSIKAQLQSNQLIIKEVSRYFTRNTHYHSEEIIGLPLNRMIPEIYRQVHQKAIIDWIRDGYFLDQNSYKIRFTCYMDKFGRQIPAFKYYKCHCSIQNGVEFVCLLNSNIKPDVGIQSLQGSAGEIGTVQNLVVNKIFVEEESQFESVPMLQSSNFSVQNNIFLKDDTLECAEQFMALRKFKWVSRLFVFLTLLSVVILSVINQDNVNNLIEYCSQYLNFMNMYRYPLFTGICYMKNFLNVGNQTVNVNLIKSLTSNMGIYQSQPTTIKGLFDTSLFVSSQYAPYYNYTDLKAVNYNQFDLFYVIISSMVSLNTFPINRTGQSFRLFNSYITPAYDRMMNITKNNLHNEFSNIFDWNKWDLVIFVMVQLILFLLFLTGAWCYLLVILKKYRNIFTILLDFHYSDVLKIIEYWQNLNRFFNNIFVRIQPYSNFKINISVQTEQINDLKQSQMFRGIKSKLIEGNRIRKQQLYIKFLVIAVAVFTLLLTVSISIASIIRIHKLQVFQNDGYFLLRYFPTLAVLGYGSMEKYYSLQYPSEVNFNPDRYAVSIQTSYQFGEIGYIGRMADSASVFYQKQKNYYFGNPCRYNSELLAANGVTLSSCLTVGRGSLSRGISSFVRYSQELMSKYVRGQNNLTAYELDSLTTGIRILSTYVFDNLKTWNEELAQNVDSMSSMQTMMTILMVVVIFVMHVFISEFTIIRKIDQDYRFICKVYQRLVPEYILIKEKVIKQKFVVQEFIVQ